MKSTEKRIEKLKQVLALLSRGEIVQNRRLKTLLGAEHYARYLDDCHVQEQLRDMLVSLLVRRAWRLPLKCYKGTVSGPY
jgi:hypothetical protein